MRIFTFLLLLVFCESHSQDLSNLGHQKPVDISGTMGLRFSGYQSNVNSSFYPPFSYIFTGNLNISIYGYAIPLSLMYTNQQFGIMGQPFNQFGISPTYRRFTFNIGYRNVSYSKYTMNGYQLYGLGVDYSKDKLKMSICYGRLKKLVLLETIDTLNNLPSYSYQRNAIAGLVKYGGNQKNISFSFLKGQDNTDGVPENIKTQSVNQNNPLPAANIVLDVQSKCPLFFKAKY